jgi:hypothetical protein
MISHLLVLELELLSMESYASLLLSVLFAGLSLSLYTVEDSITSANTLNIFIIMRMSTIVKYLNINYLLPIIE